LRATLLSLLTLLLLAVLPVAPSVAELTPVADEGFKYYWARSYGALGDDDVLDLALTPEGSIVVVGSIEAADEGCDALVLSIDGGKGDVEWAYTYKFATYQTIYGITSTPDGSLIVVGSYWEPGGPFYTFVMELSSLGGILWKRGYGPGVFEDVVVAQDGSIYVVGATSFFGAGGTDIWVLKLDASGNVVWQNTYGGPADDVGLSIALAQDGGVVVAGYCSAVDLWVLKLSSEDGSVKWAYSLGGDGMDWGMDVAITPDGDVVVVGDTASFGAGSHDVWVLRLDGATGQVEWERAYGGPGWEEAHGLAIDQDGNIYVIGYAESFNLDAWLLKLDGLTGEVIWEKAYGGASWDFGKKVAITADGDLVFVCETYSFGVEPGEAADILVFKVGEEGFICGTLYHDTSATVTTTTSTKEQTPDVGEPSGATSYDLAVSLTDVGDLIQVITLCLIEVDIAPPEVSITSPKDGAIVSGTITVKVDASDNVGVDRVEFYLDGDLLTEDTEPPFEYELDTTTKADGEHTLKAVAYDIEGNHAEDQVSITIDNTAPTISALTHEPSAPVEGEAVTISAKVVDATTGVLGVRLYYRVNGGPWKSLDMSPVGGLWLATIPGQSAGAKVEYYVEAVDLAGNTAVSNVYSYTVSAKPAYGGLETWHIILIGVVIAVIAIILIAVLLKR